MQGKGAGCPLGGMLALQRGCHPGRRCSAACFVWLQHCVKSLHHVLTVKVPLSVGLCLGTLSEHHGPCRFLCPGFPLCTL